MRKKQIPIADRYRQYEAAKANLPRGMSPQEYGNAIRELIKKFKI